MLENGRCTADCVPDGVGFRRGRETTQARQGDRKVSDPQWRNIDVASEMRALCSIFTFAGEDGELRARDGDSGMKRAIAQEVFAALNCAVSCEFG